MNNIVTTQPETLKRPDGQEQKTASLKEPQNTSYPEPLETAGNLSSGYLGLLGTTICFIAKIDFGMISSPLDSHDTLHAWINEQQYQTRYQQNRASRNWTEQIPESGICTPEMMGKEAQISPKPSLQEPITFATRDPTEIPGVQSKGLEVTEMKEEF